MVLGHVRPAYVIVTPEAYAAADQPLRRPIPGGRPLREALAMLAAAPAVDPRFAEDLETIRASAGAMPTDPWERAGPLVIGLDPRTKEGRGPGPRPLDDRMGA